MNKERKGQWRCLEDSATLIPKSMILGIEERGSSSSIVSLDQLSCMYHDYRPVWEIISTVSPCDITRSCEPCSAACKHHQRASSKGI